MRRTTRSSASASAPSSGSGSGSQAPAPAWTYDQGPDPGRALVDPRLSMPFGPDGAAPHNPSPYPLLYTPDAAQYPQYAQAQYPRYAQAQYPQYAQAQAQALPPNTHNTYQAINTFSPANATNVANASNTNVNSAGGAAPTGGDGVQCDEAGCTFRTNNGRDGKRGLKEHKYHKHLGTRCFWMLDDLNLCNHNSTTDEEFLEHFKTHVALHISRGDGSGHWRCPWPGVPGGDQSAAQAACTSTFKNRESAVRHARQHQRNRWLLWAGANATSA